MMKRIMVLINAFVLNVLELCNRDCDVWYQPLDVEIRHICFIHFMLYIYIRFTFFKRSTPAFAPKLALNTKCLYWHFIDFIDQLFGYKRL